MFSYIKIADHEQKSMSVVYAFTPGCPLSMWFYVFLMWTSVPQRISMHCCPVLLLKKKGKNGKDKSINADTITYQFSNPRGTSAHLFLKGQLATGGRMQLPAHSLLSAICGGIWRHFFSPHTSFQTWESKLFIYSLFK